jgi:hypothetical protein
VTVAALGAAAGVAWKTVRPRLPDLSGLGERAWDRLAAVGLLDDELEDEAEGYADDEPYDDEDDEAYDEDEDDDADEDDDEDEAYDDEPEGDYEEAPDAEEALENQ